MKEIADIYLYFFPILLSVPSLPGILQGAKEFSLFFFPTLITAPNPVAWHCAIAFIMQIIKIIFFFYSIEKNIVACKICCYLSSCLLDAIRKTLFALNLTDLLFLLLIKS